jgi:hypothetical protein
VTFLKTTFHLSCDLAPQDYQRLARLYTHYGIRGVNVEGQNLVVEYDASRLHEAEVLTEVRRAGIGVQPLEPIPLGGFDRTGEFKDYAWPTTGLSPVNRSAK